MLLKCLLCGNFLPWGRTAGHSPALLAVLTSSGKGQPGSLLRGHFKAEEVGQGEESDGLWDYCLGDVPVVMKHKLLGTFRGYCLAFGNGTFQCICLAALQGCSGF